MSDIRGKSSIICRRVGVMSWQNVELQQGKELQQGVELQQGKEIQQSKEELIS